jgi:hypothetical protein
MRCDIVIISHRRDLAWLSYCLALLSKNWKEPGSRIIVRLEEDCREIVQDWGLDVVYRYVRPWPDGYTFQMYQKMISDDYTDAELLLLVDSDLMLIAPASLADLMNQGKPIIHYLEWVESPVAERVWRMPTSRVMGIDLDKDYMVSAPSLYWRDTFSKARQQIVNTAAKGFFEAVYSSAPFEATRFLEHPMTFADFEALNLYAANFQPDRYFVRSQHERSTDWPFRLFWSHGDWTPQVQAFLDAKLKER